MCLVQFFLSFLNVAVFQLVLVADAWSLPTFVTRCLNGTSDGTSNLLFQVDCNSRADGGQFPISYNLNNGGNTSDITTPTLIQNCQFNGCGNIYTTVPLVFQNVIFNQSLFGGLNSQNAAGGGAVTVVNTSVSFVNVKFIGCKARTGGGVYVTGVAASVSISNVTAMQNIASNSALQGGGVLYAEAGAQVTVSQSTFVNNSAAYRGGSFFIGSSSSLALFDCNFFNGAAINSRGGDVHVEIGSILTWTGGSSTGPSGPTTAAALNASIVASGGSISLLSATCQLTNLKFQGHRVTYYGGVIYSSSGNLIIKDIQTSDTAAAEFGGVAYLWGGQNNVTILQSTFQNSYADFCGGAIFNDGLLYMSGVTAINSAARQSFGGFLSDFPGANTTIDHSIILNCQVLSQSNVDGSRLAEFGGGIYTTGASLIISYTTISMSSATFGGALAIVGSPTMSSIPSVLVTQSNFTSNSALSQGGAIMVAFCANLTINDSNLNLNSAVQTGGGILSVTWRWDKCLIKLTGTISISDNSITGPLVKGIPVGGGGIGMSQIIHSQLSGNPTLTIATANLVMTGNKAALGSAVYIDSEAVNVNYSPSAEDVAAGRVLNVQGVFYISQIDFASWFVTNNPFPSAASIRLDSPPISLSPTNTSYISSMNGSTIGLDLKVPNAEFAIVNAFGTPISYVEWTNVPIVQATFQITYDSSGGGGGGTVFHKLYKGPTTNGIVSFRNVSLAGVNFPSGFNGEFNIVYSVLLPTTSNVNSANNGSMFGSISLSYQSQECDSSHTQVESGVKSDGSIIYTCLPNSNVEKSSYIIAGGLSCCLIVITALLSISAIRRRKEGVKTKRTAFSNYLIAFGCIGHLATGLTYFIQSGASCIAAQWLDLLSFTLLLLIIIFKTSQVKTIFLGSSRMGGFQRPISNVKIIVLVLLFEICVSLFMILWTIFGPIEMILAIIWKFGLLVISLRQSFITRSIQSVYAESFPLAWITYIWTLCYAILYPIDFLLSVYPTTKFSFQLIRILLPATLTAIILLSDIEQLRSALSRITASHGNDSNQQDSFIRVYNYFMQSSIRATDSRDKENEILTSSANDQFTSSHDQPRKMLNDGEHGSGNNEGNQSSQFSKSEHYSVTDTSDEMKSFSSVSNSYRKGLRTSTSLKKVHSSK